MLYRCFHCRQKIRLTPDQLGGSIVCPHCHQSVDLPAAESGRLALRYRRPEVAARSWLSNSVSGLASLLIHMLLLLSFAAVTCEYRGASGEGGEEIRIGELPFQPLSDRPEEEFSLAAAAPASSELQEEMLELASPDESAEAAFELDLSLALPGPSGSTGELSELSAGGAASGAGASFMGVHAKGSRFCIIADRSGSMEGPKLDFVKEEILETLTTMGREGRFQLIFFNSRELPYPQSGWRHPRRDRADVAQWLQGIQAEGGTYPTPAFHEAFQLAPRPDVIFFMTDGLFPAEAVEEIARMNGSDGQRVVIHTIAFMDTSSEPLMQRIAADSGGKYRHVSGMSR